MMKSFVIIVIMSQRNRIVRDSRGLESARWKNCGFACGYVIMVVEPTFVGDVMPRLLKSLTMSSLVIKYQGAAFCDATGQEW